MLDGLEEVTVVLRPGIYHLARWTESRDGDESTFDLLERLEQLDISDIEPHHQAAEDQLPGEDVVLICQVGRDRLIEHDPLTEAVFEGGLGPLRIIDIRDHRSPRKTGYYHRLKQALQNARTPAVTLHSAGECWVLSVRAKQALDAHAAVAVFIKGQT